MKPLNEIARLALTQANGALKDYVMRILALLPDDESEEAMEDIEDGVKTESKAWAKDTAQKLDNDVWQEVNAVKDKGIAEMASLPDRLPYSVGAAFPTAAELGGVFNTEWSVGVWKQIEGEREALGLNISSRLWDVTKDAQNQINDIIKQSETEHWAYSETKDKLAELLTEKGKANVGYNVRRLWVDQVKRDHIVAQRQQWADTGYIDTIILSRSETGYECDICGEEIGDGPGASIEVPMDYAFLPPYHPWCGCTASPKMPTKESMRAFLNGEVGSPKVMALMAEKNPTLTIPMPSEEELADLKAKAAVEDFKAFEETKAEMKAQALIDDAAELGLTSPAGIVTFLQNNSTETLTFTRAELLQIGMKNAKNNPDAMNATIEHLMEVYGPTVAHGEAMRREWLQETTDFATLTLGEIESMYGTEARQGEETRRFEARATEWRERDQRAINDVYTDAAAYNVQYDQWRDFSADKGRLGAESIWTLPDGTAFDADKAFATSFAKSDAIPRALADSVGRYGAKSLSQIIGDDQIAKNESYKLKNVVTNRIADAMMEFLPAGYDDASAEEIFSAMKDIRLFQSQHVDTEMELEPVRYTDNIHNAVDMLVHAWAMTSSSGDAISCAAQEEALRIFGLNASYVDFLQVEDTMRRSMDFLAQGGNQEFIDAFLKAMYVSTQRDFADKGIKEVTLFRGMGLEPSVVKDTFGGARFAKGFGNAQMSPMSSFSAYLDSAALFCDPEDATDSSIPTLFSARVPVSRIIGSFLTGYGCSAEQEFVVLGPQSGKDKVFGAIGKYSDVAEQRLAAMLLATNGKYVYNEKDIDKGDPGEGD